jgi:hypothetical protein
MILFPLMTARMWFQIVRQSLPSSYIPRDPSNAEISRPHAPFEGA